jgi:putative transposase
LVAFLRAGFQVSERRACEVLRFGRSSQRYKSRRDPQIYLRMRLKDLAQTHVFYGYRRLHILLLREGWRINHKRTYRLYTEEDLTMRVKKPKRRRSAALRKARPTAAGRDQCWSMDFVADALADGRRFRALTIVDHFSRESVAIEVGSSLTGGHVVGVLRRLNRIGRRPRWITVDNGSEFISKVLDQWAHWHKVQLDFIRPGKPVENAFIESFNGRLRQECLSANWFTNLHDARMTIEAWRKEYNTQRPHSSLGGLSPHEFMRAQTTDSPTEAAVSLTP